MTGLVLGVDACRTGWVGIGLSGDEVRGWHAGTIAGLVDAAAAHAVPGVVAIDIPIGLPSGGSRRSDALVRERLGVRRSSLFPTLVREAYEADSYEAALMVQSAATGKGMSRQAWGLRHKVLDVDGWLKRQRLVDVVVECHPELSFATMNGGVPIPYGKKTWSGQERRRGLLAGEGIVVPSDLGDAGEIPPDDVLDAAAAAWTARRVAHGQAVSFPDEPEWFVGRMAAVVC